MPLAGLQVFSFADGMAPVEKKTPVFSPKRGNSNMSLLFCFFGFVFFEEGSQNMCLFVFFVGERELQVVISGRFDSLADGQKPRFGNQFGKKQLVEGMASKQP